MSQSPQTIDLQPYEGTLQLLKHAVQGWSAEQLKRKPAPDKWSATEVLSHLTDHQIVTSFRIRQIISEEEAKLPPFDQDPWVSRTRANESEAADLFAVYEALLVYNTLLLRRIPAEYFSRTGVNAKGKTFTLAGLLQAFVDHVHVHLAQIDRIKQAIT
ncbi:DinB family protein [Paenibacillus puerhi]|uniref:DinB family protein n=1 Tax=Paenibacillus puerhi TaxID=2692622 RepID=UPI001356F855|nr:DinB family protein [Paenibacillus puerhi]